MTDAAARLRGARLAASPIPPVRHDLPDGDLAAAYAVQDAITAADIDGGRRLVGRKIGLTSKAVQRQLGVGQPDYGMLFADMDVSGNDEIAIGQLIAPRIEAEVAFVLKAPIDVANPTIPDILAAVDYILPAFEIVDSRVSGWDIRIVDTIADNASSGLFALGARPVALGDVDLALAGMVLEVDGDPVSSGAGVACLGHPVFAVRWLADRMHALGRPLGAGDVVLSGALGPMIQAEPGRTYEARISGLGTIRARFSQADKL